MNQAYVYIQDIFQSLVKFGFSPCQTGFSDLRWNPTRIYYTVYYISVIFSADTQLKTGCFIFLTIIYSFLSILFLLLILLTCAPHLIWLPVFNDWQVTPQFIPLEFPNHSLRLVSLRYRISPLGSPQPFSSFDLSDPQTCQ